MFKNAKALTQDDKIWPAIKAGTYTLTLIKVTEGETDVKEWVGNVAKPTGEKEPQMILDFSVSHADGSDVLSTSDLPMETPSYKVFIVDKDLGYNKKEKKPMLGRSIICALQGTVEDADVAPFVNGYADFLLKSITAYLTVNPKNGKNVAIDPKAAEKKSS